LEKAKNVIYFSLGANMKNLKHYLSKATNGNFTVGAINVFNLESMQAVADASANCNSPIIAAVSEKSLIYMQDYVKSLSKSAKQTNPALFLHLDHGTTFEICKKAIDLGFDSVMIDASQLPLDENITLTKKVCCYAHKKGVLVEGELGKILGAEENASSKESIYTSPEEAARFVKETKVDMLAISIGTSHGIYKAGNGKLRFDVLQEIEKAVPNTPLVLHGASTINSALIDDFLAAGGKTKNSGDVWHKDLPYLKSVKSFHDGIKKNGHGLGMSQHGANNMAKEGCDVYQILMHYYKDIKFGRLDPAWDL
jgi:fructose-bisphosphate aldolase class II